MSQSEEVTELRLQSRACPLSNAASCWFPHEKSGSHTPDLHGSLSPTTGTQPGAGTEPGAAADKTPPALPVGWAHLQLCVATEVKSAGILVCVSRGLACSRGRKGVGRASTYWTILQFVVET